MDEKSQIQAFDRTAPILPMLPGLLNARPTTTSANGTTSLYAALDLRPARSSARCTTPPGDRVPEVPQDDRSEVPAQLDVHLVLDNASLTRPRKSNDGSLTSPVRLALHADQSSWINLVERWFVAHHQALRRGAHRSVQARNHDIRRWIDTWNDDPRPYVWIKTAEQILASITRYCQRINQTGH